MDAPKLTLCGGTFFCLVLRARKPRRAESEHKGKKKDLIPDSEILSELIRLFEPSHLNPKGPTLKNNTSQFKKCELSHSSWLPFDDATFIDESREAMKHDYSATLRRSSDFVQSYIDIDNPYKIRILGHALIELVSADGSISDEDTFILAKDKVVTKKELGSLSKVSIQELLLGIWYYIIDQKIPNDSGKETFDSWFEEADVKGAQRVFMSPIGRHSDLNTLIYSLGKDDVKFQAETSSTESSQDYSKYLKRIREKYENVKTLLYSDAPHKFDDFYVCNNIRSGRPYFAPIEQGEDYYPTFMGRPRILKNATVQSIAQNFSNHVIITGTGGLGKSMMMKHLLLDAVDHYQSYHLIPIFVSLKDYDGSYSNLVDFILSRIRPLFKVSTDKFIDTLNRGDALILLDGYDEIHSSHIAKFQRELEEFNDRFSSNMFILSSRPYSEFVHLSQFIQLALCPLSKQQALELIDKLDFRPDEPQIKSKFRAQLDSTLYQTHESFANNPLLLNIMLMTFEQYAEVPNKMHIFYREAFLTLSQKHDASKGAYKRALKTGLSSDRFSDYLSEFCARTYRDEKFEFTAEEFKRYYDMLNEIKRHPEDTFSCDDFIEDLQSNMCLIYYEGSKYHFTHRSFQEYFCAVYFSKQKDKSLGLIGDFFEQNGITRIRGDKTFAMLYDMIPDKVEEYIFLPKLKALLGNGEICSENYFSYLRHVYPVIQYLYGEVDIHEIPFLAFSNVASSSSTPAPSYIFTYILERLGSHFGIADLNLPFITEFVVAEFCKFTEERHLRNGETEMRQYVVPKQYISQIMESSGEKEIMPNVCGYALQFKTNNVIRAHIKYHELLDALEATECPFHKEYLMVVNFYKQIEERANRCSNDMFDMF